MDKLFVPDSIMIVEWVDPDTISGWATPEEAMQAPGGRVVSVGMYIGETEDFVMLALDWESDGQVNSRGRIYKPLIQRTKTIKFPAAYKKPQKKVKDGKSSSGTSNLGE